MPGFHSDFQKPCNRLSLTKAIAATLVVTFLLQDLSFANPDLKPLAIDFAARPRMNFHLPESLGQIEDSFFFEQGAPSTLLRVIPSDVEG